MVERAISKSLAGRQYTLFGIARQYGIAITHAEVG